MLLDKFVGSYLSDILLNEELKVSAWDKLNDPFEGRHKLEDYTPQQARNFIFRWDHSKRSSGVPPLNTSGFNLNRDVDVLNFIELNRELLIQNGRDTLNRLYRIACFSEHREQKNQELARREVLMWAHYGNSQKGARVVFESSSKSIPGTICKVDYESAPPELPLEVLHRKGEDIDEDKKRQLIASIYTKSDAWEYEDEQRLITELKDVKSRLINDTLFEYVPFPTEAVKTVDFGLNYDKQKRDRVVQEIRKGKGEHVNFRQCILKPNKFEFTFETIV